jgi:hypothetical protein
MPSQVVYQTNADWHDSYDAMAKNTLVTVEETKKGLLWFHFIGSQTVFTLSPTGKLQVKWSDLNEKRILYKQIRNLLVAKPNEKLTIKPLKQQMWIEYPVPKSFKLYWCDQSTEFVLNKKAENKKEEKNNTAKNIEFTKPQARSKRLNKREIAAIKLRAAMIEKELNKLRYEFSYFREPTFNEIALRSGCLNKLELETFLFSMGWKKESLAFAKKRTEQAINLAGWLNFKERDEYLISQLVTLANKAIEEASMKVLAKARIILRHYPNLIPYIKNSPEVKWPDETKIKWIEVFGCEPPASSGDS